RGPGGETGGLDPEQIRFHAGGLGASRPIEGNHLEDAAEESILIEGADGLAGLNERTCLQFKDVKLPVLTEGTSLEAHLEEFDNVFNLRELVKSLRIYGETGNIVESALHEAVQLSWRQ